MKKEKKATDEFKNAKFILEKSPIVAFLWQNKKTGQLNLLPDNVRKLFGYTSTEFLQTTKKKLNRRCLN